MKRIPGLHIVTSCDLSGTMRDNRDNLDLLDPRPVEHLLDPERMIL
jgi:hypothetical protein